MQLNKYCLLRMHLPGDGLPDMIMVLLLSLAEASAALAHTWHHHYRCHPSHAAPALLQPVHALPTIMKFKPVWQSSGLALTCALMVLNLSVAMTDCHDWVQLLSCYEWIQSQQKQQRRAGHSNLC